MVNIEFFLKFLCELLIIFIQELFSDNIVNQLFSFLKYLISCIVIIYTVKSTHIWLLLLSKGLMWEKLVSSAFATTIATSA